MLPTDSQERKDAPVYSGVLRYFPLALAAVARLSKIGNDKHNPGEPLHWSRDKSSDHGDCIVRHQMEAGTMDDDGELHDVKVAWRALAQLQLAEEKRLATAPTPRAIHNAETGRFAHACPDLDQEFPAPGSVSYTPQDAPRLSKFCAKHKRWLSQHDYCGECLKEATSR